MLLLTIRANRFAYKQFYLMSIWYLLMGVLYLLFVLPDNSNRCSLHIAPIFSIFIDKIVCRYYSANVIEENIIDSTTVTAFKSTSEIWSYLEDKFLSEKILLKSPANNNAQSLGLMMLGSMRLRQVSGLTKRNGMKGGWGTRIFHLFPP